MTLMTISEFGERTRLSPKALRMYEQLGLVVPAVVDPGSGYRHYAEDQIEGAQLVGLLRRLEMPLALIGSILVMDAADAVAAVDGYWAQVEGTLEDRRALVAYLHARLTGATPMYDIAVRTMSDRQLLSISRHLHAAETDAFFDDAFARLRAAAPGLEGVEGCPFLVFYGEVSEDSDGPLALCRPVALDAAPGQLKASPDIEVRTERSHDEAYISLSHQEATWPAMLPAYDALYGWIKDNGREPAGALRQVLIADQRSATPDTLTIDLSAPLK